MPSAAAASSSKKTLDHDVEPDTEPFELGADKWAVRFYISPAPSKGTILLTDEGRGPRLREILVAPAHSCRFLSRDNAWALHLFAFEDGPPHFDTESAPPLIVGGSANQASVAGWKAYEVVRAVERKGVVGSGKEKVELTEEEREDLVGLVKDFKNLGKKGAASQLDLGEEAVIDELKKAVKAGLLSAAELKDAEEKFKKEGEGKGKGKGKEKGP